MDVHVQRTDVHGHWPVRATDSTDIGLCVPRTHGHATDISCGPPFTTGLKPKVGVKDVIEAIPKMEMTYVRRFKKIRTFPLFPESAVNSDC